MGWRKAFGSTGEPPAEILSLLDSGEMEDLSYGNDQDPSFGWMVEDEPSHDIRVWVDTAEPAERRMGRDALRFQVTWSKDDLSMPWRTLETDDVEQALLAWHAWCLEANRSPVVNRERF